MSSPHAAQVPTEAPVVSLQAHGASDPDLGHLATGLLVGPSLVFVPSPPDELLDLAGPFEVLIFPDSPRAGDPLIERIAPAGFTVPYTGGPRRPPLGVTIRLSRPSRNALSIRREPGRPAVTGRDVERKLADGHDLWTALTELRAINPALRRAPSRQTWQRLLAAEHATEGELGSGRQGHPGRSGGLPRPEHVRGFNACWLVPWLCRHEDSS